MAQDKTVLDTVLDNASAPETAAVFPYREREGGKPSDTYKVPANTRWILIEAHGGSGGYSTGGESGGPGGGGIIRGLVPVVPGETLSIYTGDGAFHGWQGRPGYRPGGNGGTVKGDPSNGGGGGGSTAVVDSTGRVLIHAGGGGGSGGRGGSPLFWQKGGDGGSAGLSPGNGTDGHGPTFGSGGSGGKGGDTKLTERGGNGVGHDGAGAGGAGGGGNEMRFRQDPPPSRGLQLLKPPALPGGPSLNGIAPSLRAAERRAKPTARSPYVVLEVRPT